MFSLILIQCAFLFLIVDPTEQSIAGQDFDYFVFRQQWPQTTCIERNETHTYNCKIPQKTNFWTIHGLWPSSSSGESPEFCNNSSKFDPEQVKTILDRLNVEWPNLFTDEVPNSFWEHEWDKHGTCSTGLQTLDSQLKYFSKGLELRSIFDISKALAERGILPSNTKQYSYEEFNGALVDYLGFQPHLQCMHNKHGKNQTIEQLEFCLDRSSFKIIQCPHKPHHRISTTVITNKRNGGDKKLPIAPNSPTTDDDDSAQQQRPSKSNGTKMAVIFGGGNRAFVEHEFRARYRDRRFRQARLKKRDLEGGRLSVGKKERGDYKKLSGLMSSGGYINGGRVERVEVSKGWFTPHVQCMDRLDIEYNVITHD